MMKHTDFQWIRQTEGLCGPYTIKIALSYFGARVSISNLIKVSEATKEEGTLHEGMIKALRHYKCGFVVGEAYNISTLKFAIAGDRPTIVGWYKPDPPDPDDHYSVLYRIDKQYVYLVDPEVRKPVKLERDTFMGLFYDYDIGGDKVEGWFISIHDCQWGKR